MHFIDIHSHVLANWDDGAETWNHAMEMLRQGEEDGIREVVCTPHILSQKDFDREHEVLALFEELKKRARQAGITIKLHIGGELYIQPELPLNRKISTLAQNGRYYLIEFSMGMIPDFVANRFFEGSPPGKIPIIAHPERNASIMKNPQKAYEFVQKGALLQLNAGSILGVFGERVKTVSAQLIHANLVHFVASDAHDLNSRPLKLGQAYWFVAENWDVNLANRLFCENPGRVLRAADIAVGEIRSPEALPEKKSLKARLKTLLSRH